MHNDAWDNQPALQPAVPGLGIAANTLTRLLRRLQFQYYPSRSSPPLCVPRRLLWAVARIAAVRVAPPNLYKTPLQAVEELNLPTWFTALVFLSAPGFLPRSHRHTLPFHPPSITPKKPSLSLSQMTRKISHKVSKSMGPKAKAAQAITPPQRAETTQGKPDPASGSTSQEVSPVQSCILPVS